MTFSLSLIHNPQTTLNCTLVYSTIEILIGKNKSGMASQAKSIK